MIGKTAFGYEFNSIENPDHEVSKAFDRMLSGGFMEWVHFSHKICDIERRKPYRIHVFLRPQFCVRPDTSGWRQRTKIINLWMTFIPPRSPPPPDQKIWHLRSSRSARNWWTWHVPNFANKKRFCEAVVRAPNMTRVWPDIAVRRLR